MATTVEIINSPSTEVSVEGGVNVEVEISNEAKIDVFLDTLGGTVFLPIKSEGMLITGIPKSLNFIGATLTVDTAQNVNIEFTGGGDGTTGVSSVNGRTGSVTLGKNDVGLDQVDNTSDLDKPISTDTQLALDEKQGVLVSGENIKSINGESLLGSGDIVINANSGINPISYINYTLI